MSEDAIKQAMDAATASFNDLKAKADDIDDELKRLQGEYRGYENLLKQKIEEGAAKVENKVKEAATTIEAKEVTSGK